MEIQKIYKIYNLEKKGFGVTSLEIEDEKLYLYEYVIGEDGKKNKQLSIDENGDKIEQFLNYNYVH